MRARQMAMAAVKGEGLSALQLASKGGGALLERRRDFFLNGKLVGGGNLVREMRKIWGGKESGKGKVRKRRNRLKYYEKGKSKGEKEEVERTTWKQNVKRSIYI